MKLEITRNQMKHTIECSDFIEWKHLRREIEASLNSVLSAKHPMKHFVFRHREGDEYCSKCGHDLIEDSDET